MKGNIATYRYVSNEQVELVHENCIKDLGVHVSCNLSFRIHVYEKINMAYRMLGIIKRNFYSVDNYTFITLYKSFVRSHVEYAVSVWNPCTSGLIDDIEKVQKRATKYILECKHMPYRSRLQYLHLPTLKYRRLRGDMIEVFKILHTIYDPVITPMLQRNFDSRTRGNSLKLFVARSNIDLRKYSFTNRVVRAWNSLPDKVVNSVSLNSFKINIDKYFVEQDIYYDYKAEL
jgi:hypothetical protein